MLTTRFTELVGCSIPIQQAGMGSHANPRLAAAVASAGALGTVSVFGGYGGTPEHIVDMLDSARQMTSGVFGSNFVLPFMDAAVTPACVAAAASKSKLVEFFYAEPDPNLIEIVHAGGALASWQIGSREEAIAAVDAGCDLIVAQGIEAGGHVRGKIGLLALLNEVLEAVDVPVLAAGGIGSGRAMAAALAAGADGVRVGTRFLAVAEAEAHPTYLNALFAAEAKDTVYTDAYSVGWPFYAPHRLLRSAIEAATQFEDGQVIGTVNDAWNGEPYEIHRFECLAVHQSATGAVEAMSLWAGESVDNVTKMQTAAEIIHELADDAEQRLRRWA